MIVVNPTRSSLALAARNSPSSRPDFVTSLHPPLPRRNSRLPRALSARGNSPTHRIARNSIPFIALLHKLRTPPGGGSILSTPLAVRRPISAKPSRIRTSENIVHNCFRMTTSKMKHLKPFRMNTYKKTGGGGNVVAPGPLRRWAVTGRTCL
jgi:hypothetical protein